MQHTKVESKVKSSEPHKKRTPMHMYFCVKDSWSSALGQWRGRGSTWCVKRLVRSRGPLLLQDCNLALNQFWHRMNNHKHLLFWVFTETLYVHSSLWSGGVRRGMGNLRAPVRTMDDRRRNTQPPPFTSTGHTLRVSSQGTLGRGPGGGHSAASYPTGDSEVTTGPGVVSFWGAGQQLGTGLVTRSQRAQVSTHALLKSLRVSQKSQREADAIQKDLSMEI